MHRYSYAIYRTVEEYLTDRQIPYKGNKEFGYLRFSAGLNGEEQYDFRINFFNSGFWVEVPVPVTLPQTEKVTIRMAKFCCSVNLTDHTGGFLVPDPDREALIYRFRFICDQHPELTVSEGLTEAPKMVRYYREVTERLAAGKLSVEKAIRLLDNDFHYLYSARLTPPVPKEKPLSPEQLELRRRIQEALEAWIDSQEENKDNI